ncbi:DUF5999 family protein [Streptomyces sp. NPDC058542]|uniref:DUF5999 family protein n=1 Tax=Streptomyces sp. NPDC058542 TaxID=3346543 RepID=UPI0036681A4D
MCSHTPPCPPADGSDSGGAKVVARDRGVESSMLCNSVLLFEVMSIPGANEVADQARCQVNMSSSRCGRGRTPGSGCGADPRREQREECDRQQ